jgi:hypothetical protein
MNEVRTYSAECVLGEYPHARPPMLKPVPDRYLKTKRVSEGKSSQANLEVCHPNSDQHFAPC